MTGGGDRSKIKGIAAKGKKAKKKKNDLLVEDVDASKEERAAQAVRAQEEAPAKAAAPAKGSKPEVQAAERKEEPQKMENQAPAAAGQKDNRLSDAEGADKAPSYYEESEYDEEEEYESEEDEELHLQQPAKVGGWTDQGSDEKAQNQSKSKTKAIQKKKEFDPRTDKMLDINSNEDFLMESLKNFRPPQERSLNQS